MTRISEGLNSTVKSRKKDRNVDPADWLYKLSALAMIGLGLWIIWTTTIEELIYPPIQFWEGCFTSTKSEYYPGEDVKLRFVLTKDRILPGTVAWRLISDDTREVFAFASRPPTIKNTGYTDQNVHILTLPSRIDPGRYHLEGVANYILNHNKTVSYTLRSNSFTVLPPINGGSR
jgi:hypothetical protein